MSIWNPQDKVWTKEELDKRENLKTWFIGWYASMITMNDTYTKLLTPREKQDLSKIMTSFKDFGEKL